MNKKTRKMNHYCARMAFWNKIKLHINSFAGLINPIEQLMPEDKVTLQKIHYLLYQSMKLAKSREEYHKKKLLEAFN